MTNKARKLEGVESNLIMENIPSSLSIGFSFRIFLIHGLCLSLSLSISLSLSFTFVDAALQLLLCDMISKSIALINAYLKWKNFGGS